MVIDVTRRSVEETAANIKERTVVRSCAPTYTCLAAHPRSSAELMSANGTSD